jgi:arylsulfatase A-like enzyme
LTALALCIGACAREADAPAKPNILVYLPDSLRADHLRGYGYWRDTSPRLTKFSEAAVLFSRAHSQASWTKASVGTLFSGLYPSRHGAIRREHRLREGIPTLAELLRNDGYRTAAIIANPTVLPKFGFGRGFETVIDLVSGVPAPESEAIVANALEFLNEDDSRPLFLYVHGFDPHFPYEAPPPFDNRFLAPSGKEASKLIAAYDNEIVSVDHTFGELMDQMVELGVYDDTMIVFLSDHGEEFEEHSFLYHGHSLYQEQLHVPLVMKFPRGEHAGRRIDERVRIIDVFPSLLEIAGVAPPAGIDGISLLPLLQDDDVRGYEPMLFFEQDLDRFELTALISGSHKLIRRIRPKASAGVRIFDLDSDPHELADLMEEDSDLAHQLLKRLDRYESTIRGGIYFEFTNALATESRKHLVGTIEITGGSVETLASMLLEPDDSVSLDDSRRRIFFDLHLIDHPALIDGVSPPTDVDRIRFELDAEDANYSLSLASDSVNVERFDIAVGATEEPSSSPLPWTRRGRESDLHTTDRTSVEPPTAAAAYVRIYEIAMPAREVVEIDAELDAKLKALGYIGDE